MGGNYLHQASLVEAYKKLYMLGGPGHSRRKAAEKSFDESISGAMGGIGDAYQQKVIRDKMAAEKLRAQLEAKRKQEALDADQEREDVRYIKEGPEAYHEYQQVVAGNQVPTNPYKDELSRQATDREAAMTRIGGVYTPQGLQMAEKEATLNAQDRLMLRSMIQPQMGGGLGGSVPNQTPNAMIPQKGSF